MSELISGKEALIALANGEEVQIESNKQWVSVDNCQVYQFLNGNWNYKFHLKPRTITINGIEVPAPFEPKRGERYWCFSTYAITGYGHNVYESDDDDGRFINMGAWRTEDEIKQVVAALRKVFKGVSNEQDA